MQGRLTQIIARGLVTWACFLVLEGSAVGLDLTNLPGTIFEDGIENWKMDRFAGNTLAGTWPSQGPAREVGGLQFPQFVVEGGGGTIYIGTSHARGGDVPTLFEVTPTGMLRVFMEPEGLVDGFLEQCQAGIPAWNTRDNTLYLTGPNCLRRIVRDVNGSPRVEVVAGIPNVAGSTDGPALTAKLQSPRGLVCTSNGVCYWLEDSALRRIYNGTVSTIALSRPETPGYLFQFHPGYNLLSAGENDNVLYIGDYATSQYGYCVLRCDLTTGKLTRVIGIVAGQDTYGRGGKETDGPAITHVGFNSAARGLYDPFHNAIWVGGADHYRFRWLRLDGDGWVRTVFGALRPETTKQPVTLDFMNSMGISGEQFAGEVNNQSIGLTNVIGIDSTGGVYVTGWIAKDGVWRAYNTQEVK